MPVSASFYLICFTSLAMICILIYTLTRIKKSPLKTTFVFLVVEMIIWSFGVSTESIAISNNWNFMIWEKVAYIGACFIPLSLLNLARSFAYPDKKRNISNYLLFIPPVTSLIMVWTNELHHLFYKNFEPFNMAQTQVGSFAYVHMAYMYIYILMGIVTLCYSAIRKSGVVASQAVLLICGSIIPIVVNILYSFGIPGFSVYSTPTAFSITVILYAIGLFKLNFLKIMPIAMQTVVNLISDSFVVIDTDMNVLDFNSSFKINFHNSNNLVIGRNLRSVLHQTYMEQAEQVLFEMLDSCIKDGRSQTAEITIYIDRDERNYIIEITPIFRTGRIISYIILFKNITRQVSDMRIIQENQTILMERERLASLGQLIGGIAHNLKTPIMAVSGGLDKVHDLAEEYSNSIDDQDVTIDDHREIAGEIILWSDKMRGYVSYMSDIISTVKDQASQFNSTDDSYFCVEELLKRVQILVRHELSKTQCLLSVINETEPGSLIKGDLNSLVQVLDNIIINATQAYDQGGRIELNVSRIGSMLQFYIQDYGKGIEDSIKERLFKEMITTKGKNGTGLGLYMSHSTIKGKFMGKLWFESQQGIGTKFFIAIPIAQVIGGSQGA
ncbi:MAG: histidine kinase N-terminal 7TM domain-containing protein [Eubacteriales bacterium]